MVKDKQVKTTDREYYLFAFRIIGDFGVTIAVPVIIFVLIGQYLDALYGTKPWVLIAGFVLAGLLTAKLIHKKANRYGKEYQAMEDKAKK